MASPRASGVNRATEERATGDTRSSHRRRRCSDSRSVQSAQAPRYSLTRDRSQQKRRQLASFVPPRASRRYPRAPQVHNGRCQTPQPPSCKAGSLRFYTPMQTGKPAKYKVERWDWRGRSRRGDRCHRDPYDDRPSGLSCRRRAVSRRKSNVAPGRPGDLEVT